MSEHVFPSGDWLTDDDRATTLVSDLLEGLLDAVSRPDHDWPALGRQAGELASVASAMANAHPHGPDPPRV